MAAVLYYTMEAVVVARAKARMIALRKGLVVHLQCFDVLCLQAAAVAVLAVACSPAGVVQSVDQGKLSLAALQL